VERIEAEFHEDADSLGVSSPGLAKLREGQKTCMIRNNPEDAPSKI
jgi:hypothetical protein